MIRLALSSLACLTALVPAALLQAQSYVLRPQTPDVYVVMFRADWCAPCKVVEPRLASALQSLQDPAIEFVNIDISGGHGDWNANAVFDRGIVAQYNRWLGVTGFAAVIDGDTKRTLGCVNMEYDAASMATHIRNLKAHALQNTQTFDLTCPDANNPV
ncbi:MAG: thioredoxin domain-containing protein [Litorimonas sp.]